MRLPITEPAPAVGFFTTVRPKGHSEYPASLKACTPNGIVMMRMAHHEARERVADGQPDARQHQPDDVQQDAHCARAAAYCRLSAQSRSWGHAHTIDGDAVPP